jgi:hypothetical protein
VTTIASTRRSKYGMICAQCGDLMIAPEWSKFLAKQRVVNFWSCTECDFCFEAVEFVPANAKSKIDSKPLRQFSPSLLAA